jgi:hypothetical protein
VENGLSRIYIGFHFRHAVTEGIKLGTKVGKVAFNHYLRPVRRHCDDADRGCRPDR